METAEKTGKKRKLSLRWKMAIYMVCFGLLLGGGAVFLGYRTYRKALTNEMSSYAVSLANTAGAMVISPEADIVEPMDVTDPLYTEQLSKIHTIQRNSALSFLMITKEADGKTICLFDSDDREKALLPGEQVDLNNHLKIETVNEDLKQGETVITESLVDGKWQMTVIVPIKNNAGKILCYISAGIPMETIRTMGIRYLARLSALVIGITAVLTVLAVWSIRVGIVDPVVYVTNTAREFSENADISDKRIRELKEYSSGDEIEELCHMIAGMKQEIIDYMEELKRETAEKERQESELSMAKSIQEAMLPVDFPNRDELEVYAGMCPARNVGGDFYDFYYLDDDHLVLTIADVSGKGMPAALFMAISKALLKNTMITFRSTAKTLEVTNDLLMDNNSVEMFVTVWIAILEISTGKMACTSAGHEFPAVMHAGGSFELLKDRHCLALAAMAGISYTSYELELTAGDRLFLYTDGVPEATSENGELFGLDRLTDALNKSKEARPGQLSDAVRKDIDLFVGKAPQFDDITMMVLDYHGPKA